MYSIACNMNCRLAKVLETIFDQGEIIMTNAEYYYRASEHYRNAVSTEGAQRQYHLQQAKNILQNLPDGWPGKDDLMRKIDCMLY